MSKYKKGFTPLEASLIAVGLDEFNEIPQIKRQPYIPKDEADTLTGILEANAIHNNKVNEAMEILSALKDETTQAYQALRGEPNKTQLVIYAEWYTDETQEGIVLERTKLTKESLALWFAEIGELDKANKFSSVINEPTNLTPINKFNKGFTAEQCSLLATGLESYNDIKSVTLAAKHQRDTLTEQAIDAKKELFYEVDSDPRLNENSLSVAISLKEALFDEIEIAYEAQIYEETSFDYAELGMFAAPPKQLSHIDLYKTSLTNDGKNLDLENTKITKSSLAIWLWKSGHEDLANNVQKNIADVIEESNTNIQQNTWAQSVKSTEKETKPQDITLRTPESSLIDSLGIMAWLLSTRATKLKRSDKPNASQIREVVETVINDLGLNENTDNKIMLSNLNKDISTALKQLEGRFKL